MEESLYEAPQFNMVALSMELSILDYSGGGGEDANPEEGEW